MIRWHHMRNRSELRRIWIELVSIRTGRHLLRRRLSLLIRRLMLLYLLSLCCCIISLHWCWLLLCEVGASRDELECRSRLLRH